MRVTKLSSERSITMSRRIAKAVTIANTGTCRHKHGAILMQGSRVLAVGVNSYRNPPQGMAWEDVSGISIHAEVAATRMHTTVPNTTLYIVRVNRKLDLMPSHPCRECLEWLLWNTSVKEVVHS